MSKLRRILKLTAATLLLPCLLALSVYSLEQQGFFKIEQIQLNVKALSSQKHFISPRVRTLQAQLDIIKGTSLWKAPLSQISKNLKNEKWVRDFQISRVWPAGIRIDIETDDVALLVLTNAEEASVAEVTTFKPITQTGSVLEKIDSKTAPNSIITRDKNFLISEKIRVGGLNVIRSLPAKGKMTAALVSEIGYVKNEGYWIKLLNSETRVEYGEDQFEIKSARVSQVIDYLESRNLKARVIDANLSKKVLVRLQQSP